MKKTKEKRTQRPSKSSLCANYSTKLSKNQILQKIGGNYETRH